MRCAAARGHVEGLIGDTDPLVAVRETLEREPFDEVIVSTLPARVSHWLHPDLPSRRLTRLAVVPEVGSSGPVASCRLTRVTRRCLVGAGRVVLGSFHQFRAQQGILR